MVKDRFVQQRKQGHFTVKILIAITKYNNSVMGESKSQLVLKYATTSHSFHLRKDK